MKSFYLILLVFPIFGFAQTDTISIYFDIGKFEANLLELEKLKVAKNDWQKVDIISYTDYLGSAEMNNKLSLNRSYEMRARLVQFGLNTELLGNVEGKGVAGETLDHSEGIQENRRTDVVISYQSESASEAAHTKEKEDDNNSKVKIINPIKRVELQDALAESKVGDHLILSDMIFLPGQHFLTEESAAAYDELFQVMKKNPKLKIKIEGHICCKIDDEDGLDLATNKYNLSEARAEYIYDILIEDGIAANRLSFEGFARENPLYPDEKTEEEKVANRRVEIRVLEK